MKSILLVCHRDNIDRPLRRSIAHLVNSCQVEIIPDGYHAFQTLTQKAFDLIIIDLTIEGMDSLELAESINHIDPGVPVILMINQEHKSMWGAARTFNANPILRPFKPLTFLRLVDTLLHQHLERYRDLSDTIKSALQTLSWLPQVDCAFLLEEAGLPLMAVGRLTDESILEIVAQLSAAPVTALSAQLTATPADHNLYLATIVENLYLALLVETGAQPLDDLWLQIDTVVQDIKEALYTNTFLEAPPTAPDDTVLPDNPIAHKLIPLNLALPPEAGPDLVNWDILSGQPNVLSRLQHILSG